MAKTRKVAVLVGSLRKGSFTRMTAKALVAVAPENLQFEFLEYRQLPLYDQDLDDNGIPPAEWVEFRRKVKAAEAVLFATPEYNRSMPGGLKNAIDVASRPYGQNAFDGKPAAVASVTPGAIGAFGSNHHLRQSLVFLNVPCMQQPEAYIGGASKLFDENGNLVNDKTREFLRAFMKAFADWIEKIAG